MKKLAVSFSLTFLVFSLIAQTSQRITLEDIFTKGTFRTESIQILRSMNDGEHYTTLENNTKIVIFLF